MIFSNFVLVSFTLFTKILQSHTQNMAKGGLIVGGAVLLVIAVIGYVIPVNDVTTEGFPITITIPNAVGICNSDLGQLGQVYSSEVAQSCSMYSLMVMGIYGSGILGIVLIAVGAGMSGKKKENYEKEVDDDALDILDKRYAKGEITKEEFDKMKKDLE